ncbi:MAG: hypothetical protein AAB779_02615 [Patescibacteria group bacterium]
MAQSGKKVTRQMVDRFNADFSAAQKEFEGAYAKLRRFLDKQKLNALRKNLGKK